MSGVSSPRQPISSPKGVRETRYHLRRADQQQIERHKSDRTRHCPPQFLRDRSERARIWEESKTKEPDQRIGNRGVGQRRDIGKNRITRAAPTQSQGIEIQAPDIGRRDRSNGGAPHQARNVQAFARAHVTRDNNQSPKNTARTCGDRQVAENGQTLCTGIVFFLTSQYLEVNDIKWYSKLRWPNAMFTLREIFYNEKFRARAWQAKIVAVRSVVLHLKSCAGR